MEPAYVLRVFNLYALYARDPAARLEAFAPVGARELEFPRGAITDIEPERTPPELQFAEDVLDLLCLRAQERYDPVHPGHLACTLTQIEMSRAAIGDSPVLVLAGELLGRAAQVPTEATLLDIETGFKQVLEKLVSLRVTST